VLDVGCGDGALLQLLSERRQVDGRGVEVSRERVNACVARGLSVIQGDADRDLADYPDDAFDYAILSLTIQATRQPKTVLEHLLRIGRKAIVSFPQLRALARAGQFAFDGPHAGDGASARGLVCQSQRPLVHDQGFRRSVPRGRCARRAGRRLQCLGQQLGTWIPLTVHNMLGEKGRVHAGAHGARLGREWIAVMSTLHIVFSEMAAHNLRHALREAGRADRVACHVDNLALGPINPPDLKARLRMGRADISLRVGLAAGARGGN